jgi:hypothetical protein
MISLSDSQLQTVIAAAAPLPPEKRDLYLQRLGAMLAMRGRVTDADVAEITALAYRAGAGACLIIPPAESNCRICAVEG